MTNSTDIYTVLKKEIDAESGKKYKTDLVNQCKRYNLSDEQSELISKIVLDNARQMTLYKYIYKNSPEELDEKIEATKTNFDWTIQYTLTKQGIKTNLSNYCTILKLTEQLALTQDQVENFLSAGWDLFQKKQINEISSIRDEQHKVAKIILNHEQYEDYLSYNVMDKVNRETQALWREAERLGITQELDSASVYTELFAYELERAKIRERYKIIPDGQEERDELLSNLSAGKPKALRQIHALRSREAARRHQDKNARGW